MSAYNRLDYHVGRVIEHYDSSILMTSGYKRPRWVGCNRVDLWHSDGLSINQIAAHDVKENDVARVVANYELVLLSDQPSHASCLIFLQRVAPRGELETLFDRALTAVAIFSSGSDYFCAVPE